MNNKEDKSSWFSKPSSERFVISLCLQDVNSYIETRSKLKAIDFLSEDNRTFFVILDTLYALGIMEFDIPSIVGAAQDMGVLEEIGGYSYIDALFKSKVNKTNLEVYIKQILDASLKYKLEQDLRDKAEFVCNSANNKEVDASSVLSIVENSILSLSLDTLKVEDGNQISLGLRERLRKFELNPSQIRGLKCGFNKLDRIINGFAPGTLSVVAARPKTGKSVIMMNWATHMCLEYKVPILYIDTEMTTGEIQTRQLH